MAKAKKQIPTQTDADKELGILCDYVTDSDRLTLWTRDTGEKCRDYYDSKQLTGAELAQYKKQKQAPVVINRCKPKMDALMGMEKAAKTTAKAYARTPKHEKGAEAATEGIRFVLEDNNFDQTRSGCWENLLIEGTCGGEVIVKPNGDNFDVCINYLFWDRMVWDPYSRRKDFADAKYLGQYVWMDYDDAVAKYPGKKEIFDQTLDGSSTYDDRPRWADATRRRVKIVELYYRKGSDIWYCCFTRGGYCEDPKVSPFIDEDGITEWPYEFASCFVTRDGGRYGAMYQLLDVQDEINKRRSKALHLMSVRQVRGERGAVDDVNKARAELARPDGYVETTPGMEWEILKTGDMATAQFQLLEEAKAEIDAVGANAAVQGKDKSVQSGIALQRRQQAGQTEIGPMFDVLRYWQLRMYRKVWKRIRQYWKGEKWIRVTDDETNLRWVGLNKPITMGEQALQQAQEAGMPPEQLQMLQQRIAQDPAAQQVVDTHNDIAELDVDIIISEVPDVLTAQIEDFQTLGEMVKSGFPIPPKAVIMASPLSQKDKILKMMDEQPQVPPEIQDKLKQAGEQTQQLQQQLQQKDQELQQAKQDQSAEQQKLSMKSQADAAKRAEDAAAQQEEFARERAMFEQKKTLELDKHNHAVDLQERQHAQACKQQQDKMAFDRKCRNEDQAAQVADKNEQEAAKLAPQLGETMAQGFAQMIAVMKEIAQGQQALLAAYERPRSIQIGKETRSPDGKLTGATVTPTLQ